MWFASTAPRRSATRLQHNGLFLLPVWRTLGKARWVLAARTLPKTIAILLALAAAGVALVLVPADFRIEGKGTLQPVHRKEVFAQIEGTVYQVSVEHGSQVIKGQELARMRNTDFGNAVQRPVGPESRSGPKPGAAKSRLLELKNRQRTGQSQVFGSRRRSPGTGRGTPIAREDSRARTATTVARRKKETADRAQSDRRPGHHLGFEESAGRADGAARPGADERLRPHRSLGAGSPDARGSHGLCRREHSRQFNHDDLDVSYILANDPGEKHEGKIKDVHLIAEARGEDGNTVMVYVDINKADLGDELQQGAGVSARVDCGKRSIGFVWFHDLIEFVQSRILFRL